MEGSLFAILRGANGRRHEVDFNQDPVIVKVSMNAAMVQITMTAADSGDPGKGRYVTVALPREALVSAWRRQLSALSDRCVRCA
jgi:hypothetical protein